MDEPATPKRCKPSIEKILYGKSKVVLCVEERGLAPLHRGWRTPDPSPIRTQAGVLSKCAAYNAKELSSRSPSPQRGSVFHAEPEWARIRTPSPEPLSRAPWSHATVPPMLATQIQEVHHGTAKDEVQMQASSLAKSNNGTRWADVEGDSLPTSSPSGLLASLGSAGHPYDCSPACKYATRTKGCKDGRNCIHCHLCAWKRTKRSRKKKTESNLAGQHGSSLEADSDRDLIV